MIHVIDYGLGNVQAFLTLYKRLGFEATRAKTATDLTGATKIILPGVGAFDHAIELLNQSGMRPTLEALVVQDKVPVLGICVGMQILASASDEGHLPGLGWVPGKVYAFRANEQSASLPLPHMGWNDALPIYPPYLLGLKPMRGFIFCILIILNVTSRHMLLQLQPMVLISVVRSLPAMSMACSFTLKKVIILARSC